MRNLSRERDPLATGSQHLGRAIRGLRRDRGLTLTQLSESSGLSVPFLSQVENNRARPSLQSLAAIANALSCNVVDIMTAAQADCVVDVSRASDARGDRNLARAGGPVVVEESTRAPGGGQAWQAHIHDVVLYVVRGTVAVDVRVGGVDDQHELGAGDRLLCGGGAAYRWEAIEEPAVVIAIRVDDRAYASSVDTTPST